MLNREQTRATALRSKSKRLALDYDAAREREGRAKALLDELLDRQRELTSVLDRANSALRRNQEVMAQATPQVNEMLQALPEREREAWIERLAGIRDLLTEDQPGEEGVARPAEVVLEWEKDTAVPVPPLEAEFELIRGDEPGHFDGEFILAAERREAPSMELDLPGEEAFAASVEPDIFSVPFRDDGFRLSPPPVGDPLTRLDDSFRLAIDPGDSTRLQRVFDLPEAAMVQPGQLQMFDGRHLLPILDSSFTLSVPDGGRTYLRLEPCPPDHFSRDSALPLGSPSLDAGGQLNVLIPALSLSLDSRFSLTPPNGEHSQLALDDTFHLEMPTPNGFAPTLSLPFPDVSGYPYPATHPALDFTAIADVPGLPCPIPEPPVPTTRACPRCGRESDASHVACPYCYAAMERQAAARSRGIVSRLMRVSGRNRE